MGARGTFKLIVKAGPSQAREFELSKQETVLGRDPAADVVLTSSSVSREHARITRAADGYVIEDLGSSNGTFINGNRITGPVALKGEDEIGLGQAVKLIWQAPSVEAVVDQEAATRLKQSGAAPPIAPTVLGDVQPSMDEPAVPPQFTVAVAGSKPEAYTLTKDTVTIGRSSANDIVVDSKIVSRVHAHLEREDGGYRLVVLPEASNPVYFEGLALSEPRRLSHEDLLRIGGQDPGSMVTLTYLSPSEAFVAEAIEITFEDKRQIQIGRDTSNEVVLDTPQVSRFHAHVEQVGQRYRIRDLRSTNGTFVNDKQIKGEVWLKPDDTIRIGPYRFVVGEDALAQYDDSSSLRVEAVGLNKWVRKDLNILQDISLVLQPREFVVVVGQSGGGKSTLVDAIAGYRPATHGRVFVNGTNIYKNFDAIRNIIGYVPQKDIIHMELTVYQALAYTAQLRMPPDTTKTERHNRVMEVMEDLDLTHRKDVQISGLSGGQQKRVSIGVELLTKPGLFFLDEPTSGLDPGTETALMHLMRRMADRGRTIVLITHATKNVLLADKVVFLARGGYLTWFGPPDEALEYFDPYRSDRERRASEMEFDAIYAILDDASKGAPEQWAERYQEHPAYRKYLVQPLQSSGQEISAAAQTPKPVRAAASKARRQVSSLRQFLILSSRNIKILIRDRFSLALMLAAAPLVALLDVVLASVLGSNPFDFYDGDFAGVMITLFLLTVYGVMVGGLAMMREFVKETDIYKRERLVNLKIVPYVLSKIWVAALLALYMTAIYVIVHYLAFDMPGGTLELILIYITLALATMAGMMLGLFGSALAPNANAAPLIVILFMLPQIVLGGALVPLPDFVSAATSTRWAFQGLMGITGVGSAVAADLCWSLPEEQRKSMSLDDKEANGCKCLGISALRESSCDYPGLGVFYNEAVDQPPPEALRPPPERPEDPIVPDPPKEPEDQSDNVAVAEYLGALQEYQTQVVGIQADAQAAFAAYEAEVGVYQAEAIAFQEEMVSWQIARESAVQPAEGLIGLFEEDFGWTYVDKESPGALMQFVTTTWLAQGAIIFALFIGILILQKRKDVT